MSLGRYWAYNRYVAVHKWHVFWAAWKLGVPWLGLLHDLSKYLPDEHRWYARYFYAPDGSKQTWQGKDGFYVGADSDTTFDRAWLKHIRRNRHHPQHWVEVSDAHCGCYILPQDRYRPRKDVLLHDDGGATCLSCLERVTNTPRLISEEMPERYRREMLADWIGAGAAQGTPDTLGWYLARGHRLPFACQTRRWVEDRLGVPSEQRRPGARDASP